MPHNIHRHNEHSPPHLQNQKGGNMDEPKKIIISVYLEASLHEAVRAMAARENRAVSNYIETVLKNHVEKGGK